MKNTRQKEILAICLVLAAATMWGCIGIFVRHLSELGFGSSQMTAVKCLMTAVLIFLLILVKDRSLLRIRKKDIILFLINGVCSIFIFNTAYSMSVTLLPLSTAVVLLYTAPIFVMIMSVIFFKEKFTARKGLCLVLCVGGTVLVSGLTGGLLGLPVEGLLIGLVSGIGYALYSIMTGVILDRGYHPFTNILYTFLIAGIAACFTCDMGEALHLTFGSTAGLFWMLSNGLVTSFLAYVCYTTALRYIKPSKAAILASIEPVVATLVGILIYHESLTLTGTVGIIVVFCALILSNLPEKNEQNQ